MEAKKRKREIDVDESTNQVRFEYLCPITHKLPIEPVIAEDGELYELEAITTWFEKNKDAFARSPMTNKPIGKRLVPALHVSKAIARLINSGVISGEDAQEWKERQDELQSIDPQWRPTLTKAHKGDARSMRIIGFYYKDGVHGFKQNQEKYIEWIKKAAMENDPVAVGCNGVLFIRGINCSKDVVRGVIELTRAAMLGSENAAICIANHYSNGEHLIAKDENEATRWYKFSKTCSFKDAILRFQNRRDVWLEDHDIAQ